MLDSTLVISRAYADTLSAYGMPPDCIMGMNVIVSDLVKSDTCFVVKNPQFVFDMPLTTDMPIAKSFSDIMIRYKDVPIVPPMSTIALFPVCDAPKPDAWQFVYLFPLGRRGYVRRKQNKPHPNGD